MSAGYVSGEGAEAGFDAVSEDYEGVVDEKLKLLLGGEESDYYLRLKARELVDQCRRMGFDPAGAAALDVGSGTGRMVQLLSGSLRRVRGVEPSAGMRARAAALDLPPDSFAAGTAQQLPFGDAAFDLVLSSCIFHHADADLHPAMVREMCRVLRPGGLFFLFEHNPLNPLTRWVVSRCPLDAGVELHRAGSLRRVCAGAPLDQLAVRYIVFLPRMLGRLRSLEPRLHRLPAGGQYYLCGRRSV